MVSSATDPVETAPRGTLDGRDSEAAIVPGTVAIDRFVVLEELGTGAMGQVVRAYDPRLHREVALKQLKSASLGVEGQARLVLEAQAMAQLNHPNVVAVYDVEVDADTVTIVMELADGRTLAEWLRDRPGWREIVRAFIEAGRGLDAAHHKGLVHRDFKPTNAIVGDDGRVRVLDFGVATAVGRTSTRGPADVTSSRDGAESLTAGDLVVGTPRYMAPEQHAGDEVDGRADQYALCVALWEALTGAPPFRGRDPSEAKRAGPPAWPGDRRVPRRIVDAIGRGLAPQPDDRWPSMVELLDALSRNSRASGRRLLAVAGGGIAIAAGLAAWTVTAPRPCQGAAEHIARAWDDAARASVREAIVGTDTPFAEATWAAVGPRLDAYAATWASQHEQACEATTVRGEQSPQVLDMRMACLDRARDALGLAVEILETADTEVVERATQLVDGLPRLDRCSDLAALQAEVPPPSDPDVARAVEAAEVTVARADALIRAGDYDAALELLEGIGAEVDTLDHPPTVARVALARGRCLGKLERGEAAVEPLSRAFELSLTHGPRRVAAASASALAWTLSRGLARHDAALWLAEVGLGLATAMDDDLFLASALEARGVVLFARGEYAPAEAAIRDALALRIERLGSEHADVANTYKMLGSVLHDSGQYDEAIAQHRHALEIHERALGPDHPLLALVLNNLAISHNSAGHYDDAVATYERAQLILERTRGRDSLDVSFPIDNKGNTLRAMGRPKESLRAHRRALEIREAQLPPGHPLLASSLANVAITLLELDRAAEAEPYMQRVIAAWEGSDTPYHPSAGVAHANLAAILTRLGRVDEADAESRRALEIWEKGELPAGHVYWALPLENLGSNAYAAGRYEEARQYLQRAVEAGADHSAPVPQAERKFKLAKVLWELDGHKSQARELAEQARAVHVEQMPGERLEEIEAWLATHR